LEGIKIFLKHNRETKFFFKKKKHLKNQWPSIFDI
jgi:hypothetical protein